MNHASIQRQVTRREDGKVFDVVEMAHWSSIRSEDGETDLVKAYGCDRTGTLYVSSSKGFTYLRKREFG